MVTAVPTAPVAQSGQLVVIDASVWISNLLPRDRNHLRAANWVNQHLSSGGQLVAPVLLALETGGSVARVSQDKNLARNAVLYLYISSFMQLVPINQALMDDATDIAITFALKGGDSLYVAVAQQLNLPLVTFDREQLTRPASIITTIRP